MKVYLATPMHGGLCTSRFAESVMDFVRDADFKIDKFFMSNEALITRARNMLVHCFLKTDATHLLFVDGDIDFNSKQVIKMIKSDKDVICGIYPKKYINWNGVCQAAAKHAPINQVIFSGLDLCFNSNKPIRLGTSEIVEVDRAGTGMMCIKREVFEKLADKVPTYKAGIAIVGEVEPMDDIKQFFDATIDPDTGLLESEDFHFCRLCKNNDIKIHVACWVILNHIGSHVFGIP